MSEYREPLCRAPQFAPYESLRGYHGLVEASRFHHERRIELSDEEIEKINRRLKALRKGDTVNLTCYRDRRYVSVSGTLREIDPVFGHLTVGKISVAFSDILAIR